MTRVYGYSDDNVVFGDDEIGCYCEDVVIAFDDCTIIRVGYGKKDLAVWWIEVAHKGSKEHALSICTDEDADIYSDIFEIDADVVFCNSIKQKYPNGKPL